MDLAGFATLDDWEKLVIVEVELSRKLQGETWTQSGAPNTNAWYIAMPDDGAVHKVVLDGSELTGKFTVALCHATASTFYYDDLNKTLYIHTTDSDDPKTLDGSDPKYCIVAYFNEFFSNRPKTLEPFEDVLAEANGSLEFWDSATDAEDWVESKTGTSTITREATVVYGSRSAYAAKIVIDGSANFAHIYSAVSVKPRRKCRLRFKYRSNGVGYARVLDLAANVYLTSAGAWQAGSANCIALADTSGAYTEVEIEFVAHESYSAYYITIGSTTASITLYVDDVELLRYRREVDCHVFLPSGSIPSIYQGVGDYYQPDEQIQFGTIHLINDGWFWDRKGGTYLWHNRKVSLWVGKLSESYDDLAAFGTSFTRKPRWGDIVDIDVEDGRILLRKLPPDDKRFDSTTYPNCEDEWVNRPLPILFGDVKGITPPQSNTSTYVFKVMRTVFSSTFNQEALSAVYKAGALQTITTHYTVDLAAGTFTMVSDPGSDEITCDAKGNEYAPISGNAYNYELCDIVYFIYVECNDISKYDLDMKSLVDFATDRTPICGWWLEDETDSIDFLIMCKQTGIYQSYISLDGKVVFEAYTSDVPSTAPHFYNYDYLDEPRFEEDTDQCYKTVACRSQYHPDLANYLYEEESSEDDTEREHNVKERLVVDTILYMQTQAATLAANYMKMLKDPIEVLTVTVKNPAALLLNPTDKAYFSYTREDEDGNTITVQDEVAFRILSLEKNLNDGTTRIRAIPDLADFHWTFP